MSEAIEVNGIRSRLLRLLACWVVAACDTSTGKVPDVAMSDTLARAAAPTVAPSKDAPAAQAPADLVSSSTVRATTPAAGSRERAEILDAVRRRLKSTSRFKVDHIRVAGRLAFVRATEVVPLDGDEQQETDLSIAALLERPADSTSGGWRVTDYWSLPDENERPLAGFTRRVRERVRAERLPASFLPGDL
jgi:hypothetical protein